jgi:hypothetical protein
MNILPKIDKIVVSEDKFTEYVLNLQKDSNKCIAFERALGYNLSNYRDLITNIKSNIAHFNAVPKGDKRKGGADNA